MIDLKTEKGNTEIREISGNATELIADCIMIVGLVSRAMKKYNLKHAGALEDMLKDGCFAARALESRKGTRPATTQISKKELTEGLLALQKFMEKHAKGGSDVIN